MIDLKNKIKEGDHISVEFWDHVEGGDGHLALCRVYGECRGITPSTIRVCGWSGLSCGDDETIWTLALACVEVVTMLKPCDIIISNE